MPCRHPVLQTRLMMICPKADFLPLCAINFRDCILIDKDGFRSNVGIILANPLGQVLWAGCNGGAYWQFPQGGIKSKESPEQALYRELHEEVGLEQHDVQVLGCTSGWLKYKVPRKCGITNFVGQKQKWFLLKMLAEDSRVKLDGSPKPEFDSWRWVSYWYPLGQVVHFKQEVYRRALKELAPYLADSHGGKAKGQAGNWPSISKPVKGKGNWLMKRHGKYQGKR